jgi:hypothetical protein
MYLHQFCAGNNYWRRGGIIADLIALIAGVVAVYLFSPPQGWTQPFVALSYIILFLAPAAVAWIAFFGSFLWYNKKIRNRGSTKYPY